MEFKGFLGKIQYRFKLMIFHGDRVRNRRVREDGTFPVLQHLRIPRTEAPVKSEQLTYMVAKK